MLIYTCVVHYLEKERENEREREKKKKCVSPLHRLGVGLELRREEPLPLHVGLAEPPFGDDNNNNNNNSNNNDNNDNDNYKLIITINNT